MLDFIGLLKDWPLIARPIENFITVVIIRKENKKIQVVISNCQKIQVVITYM